MAQLRNTLSAFGASSLLLVLIGILLIRPEQLLAQAVTVTSFDLGEAKIQQNQFAPDSRFYNMPVTLQGVLAVPQHDGPFPVALVVHGSYQFCDAVSTGDDEVDVYPCPPENDLRQFEGFSYLAEALAAHGYIALIPDLSAEFNNGFGEVAPGVRSTQIITAHLNALQTGEGYTIDVAGKADLSRLVIVTHSRGGPSALQYMTDNASRPVQALVMLTPAAAMDVQIPASLPTALVISECDGDVHTDQPLTYWEQLPPLRPTLTTVYSIPGGTHNAFSSQLGEDPFPVCESARLMDPQRQRDFAAKFVPDFFDTALALGHLGDAQ